MSFLQKLFGKLEPKQSISDENRQQARDDMNAMSSTLFMLAQQLLLDENYEQAFKQFKLIAENDEHHVDSQFNLAIMCQRGLGTEKNIHEAIRWYEAAANNGDEKAMYNLGAIYHDGAEGAERDDEKYFHWMRMAAQNGNDRAHSSLNQRFTKAIQDIARDLKLSPQWIADKQIFQVHIPNPEKWEDELVGIIKVGAEILFLTVYPFGAVCDDLKLGIEAMFDEVNKKTHVIKFGVNADNNIHSMAVMDAGKMMAEADNFEELTQMLHMFIDTAAGESMWMYNKLFGE